VSVPLVDVVHGARVEEGHLATLARVLPHAVSVAVACPEEPYDHDLRPGDVEVRFRPHGPYDVSGLDVVVEVRSTWTPSRDADRQRRTDGLCSALLEAVGDLEVGVFLVLPVAAWAQSDPDR
jgi:hypothetical protein